MPSPTGKLSVAVRSRRNLEASWRVIRENGRSSKSPQVRSEIKLFDEDASRNIDRLYRLLQRGDFEFPAARGVAIPKDKRNPKSDSIRPIVLADVRSRVVQRAILNVLTGLPELSAYVDNPHSFGGIRKGGQRTLTAVPAAIQAVLDAIGAGANFVMCADITGFFTRIPKPAVTKIISDAAGEQRFVQLFEKAIHVELANMDQLRRHLHKFPIEEIGVAQGNSLSPLLGNILLHDFDKAMNEGDCACVRYIDDFIILAPTAKAANARMRLARKLLAEFDMSLSAEKSSQEPISVNLKIEFLGIELANGYIRPSRKALNKFLSNVDKELDTSATAFAQIGNGGFSKRLGLIATLKRVDGLIEGWGKHYRFCNDRTLFQTLDAQVNDKVSAYLGRYSRAVKSRPEDRRALLGLEDLGSIQMNSLVWPSRVGRGDVP